MEMEMEGLYIHVNEKAMLGTKKRKKQMGDEGPNGSIL